MQTADLPHGEALWMAGGQGRIWRGAWREGRQHPRTEERELERATGPPECWASPSEGTTKDFEVGGAAKGRNTKAKHSYAKKRKETFLRTNREA